MPVAGLKLFKVMWLGKASGVSFVPASSREEALEKARKGYDVNFEQSSIIWKPNACLVEGDWEPPPTQAERRGRELECLNDRGEPIAPHPPMELCECPNCRNHRGELG